MKILVYYPFPEEKMASLRQLARMHGDHQLLQVASAEEAVREAANARGLMGAFDPVVCAAAPQLEWVQSSSAGMDGLLFPEIVERDVVITNMAGGFASHVAEHAWGLLLALSRGIGHAVRRQMRHEWGIPRSVTELTGGTLFIVGLGGVGREIARRAAGYDMTILAVDPVLTRKPADIAELETPDRDHLHGFLKRADAVVIACPRTDETYHMIAADELTQMGRGAYLVNIARGGIVDEGALKEALEAGKIAGAALDVCEDEPLGSDHPLWDTPNLIITPHLAGGSQHREESIFEVFYRNLARYLKGEELVNLVSKTKGY